MIPCHRRRKFVTAVNRREREREVCGISRNRYKFLAKYHLETMLETPPNGTTLSHLDESLALITIYSSAF